MPPADPLSPALERLRDATRDAHRRLERRMPLHAPGFGLAAYHELLAAFYGFHAPLEAALGRQAGAIPGLQWDERARLPRLAEDLLALGTPAARLDELARCRALPPLDTRPQALGCLYVMEGSTLGGLVIRGLLLERLGEAVHGALAFFAGDRAGVARRWTQFLRCLAELRGGAEIEAAADTAVGTFGALEAWLAQREVLA